MSNLSESSHFQVLFESALQNYERQTGTSLAREPLAEQFERCNSLESVVDVLQGQARAFGEFQGGESRVMRSLKCVVSVLYSLSTSTVLGEAIGLPFPPAKAIFAAFAVLLVTAKDVGSDHDVLVDLLESIERFLNRLNIYTRIPLTVVMAEVIVKIMVELLSTLALVTKHIKQKRPVKFVKKLLGENEVEAVLQRLDRLTQDEARTTAAQTLEVVHGLVRNMRMFMDDGKTSVLDSVRQALEIMQQLASDMNKSKRDRLQQDIRSWLSPPDPWKNHNTACESRYDGTATWFVQGIPFSIWKSSGPSTLLWVHAKPGAGKSILCSSIIQDIDVMRKSGLASLAFFYCDFREDQKRDRRGLLSSMLVQLCHQSDSYCDILSKFYLGHASGSQNPSDNALVRCLKDLLELPGQAPVYLVLDALDEYPDTSAMPSPREKVLMLLEELIISRIPNLHVCVTSRPETDIKVALDALASCSVSLHDESGQVQDIHNYIRSVVNTDPKMKGWTAEDKELVINVLTTRADGMFRWVYCQLVYMRGCLPGRIRHALAELPDTLDETYERTLREINKANWESAHRLFQCVAVASRPLHVKELADFLAFGFDAGPVPKFHVAWRLDDPVHAVLSTCSTLLSVVNVDGYPSIQFSHFSVKEFLTSSRLCQNCDPISRRYYISPTPAHSLVAQACLGILLHLDENITSDSLQSFPLAEYAAQYWAGHAQFENISRNVEDGMKHLFHPSKLHLAVWVWIYDPNPVRRRRQRDKRPTSPDGTPLHYAVLLGLCDIIKFLVIEHSQDVNALGFDGLTPLHLASSEGHGKVVRVLLENGADARAQGEDRLTPLHLASEGGHVDVVRILIENGVDTEARDWDGSTPLHRASCWGHMEAARVLLEHGAGATAQDNLGSTPLHLASQGGHAEIVQTLLERGIDATVQNMWGSTPLHLASAEGHVQVVRVLLHHGVDATIQNVDGSTPLHLASAWRRVEVMRVLLEFGVDATTQDKKGWTPLHVMSNQRQANIARVLLEYGANSAAQDWHWWTPLHVASYRGGADVARVLLDYGADASDKDKDGRTPLHLASREGHVDVTRVLLEYGAGVTAQDINRRTPSHVASERGFVDVSRILLEHEADPSAQDKGGWTPLHLASKGGLVDVVRVLLDYGADVTAQDRDGWTPLHRASRGGHLDVTRILLEHGAVATARDKLGWAALHRASRGGHVDVARFILEYGADPGAKNNRNRTPFQEASEWGHRRVMKLLSDHGAGGVDVVIREE